MKLKMSERRVLVKAFAVQYRKGSKKEKGVILERKPMKTSQVLFS